MAQMVDSIDAKNILFVLLLQRWNGVPGHPLYHVVQDWSPPSDANTLQANVSQCILDVVSWTSSNRLQLNAQKTKFIWCTPARRRHRIPNGDVQVGHGSVHPVQSARDLGVYVDGGMTMRTRINHVLSCT